MAVTIGTTNVLSGGVSVSASDGGIDLQHLHFLTNISDFGDKSYIFKETNKAEWLNLLINCKALYSYEVARDYMYNHLSDGDVDYFYENSEIVGECLNARCGTIDRYYAGNTDSVLSGITPESFNSLEDKFKNGLKRYISKKTEGSSVGSWLSKVFSMSVLNDRTTLSSVLISSVHWAQVAQNPGLVMVLSHSSTASSVASTNVIPTSIYNQFIVKLAQNEDNMHNFFRQLENDSALQRFFNDSDRCSTVLKSENAFNALIKHVSALEALLKSPSSEIVLQNNESIREKLYSVLVESMKFEKDMRESYVNFTELEDKYNKSRSYSYIPEELNEVRNLTGDSVATLKSQKAKMEQVSQTITRILSAMLSRQSLLNHFSSKTSVFTEWLNNTSAMNSLMNSSAAVTIITSNKEALTTLSKNVEAMEKLIGNNSISESLKVNAMLILAGVTEQASSIDQLLSQKREVLEKVLESKDACRFLAASPWAKKVFEYTGDNNQELVLHSVKLIECVCSNPYSILTLFSNLELAKTMLNGKNLFWWIYKASGVGRIALRLPYTGTKWHKAKAVIASDILGGGETDPVDDMNYVFNSSGRNSNYNNKEYSIRRQTNIQILMDLCNSNEDLKQYTYSLYKAEGSMTQSYYLWSFLKNTTSHIYDNLCDLNSEIEKKQLIASIMSSGTLESQMKSFASNDSYHLKHHNLYTKMWWELKNYRYLNELNESRATQLPQEFKKFNNVLIGTMKKSHIMHSFATGRSDLYEIILDFCEDFDSDILCMFRRVKRLRMIHVLRQLLDSNPVVMHRLFNSEFRHLIWENLPYTFAPTYASQTTSYQERSDLTEIIKSFANSMLKATRSKYSDVHFNTNIFSESTAIDSFFSSVDSTFSEYLYYETVFAFRVLISNPEFAKLCSRNENFRNWAFKNIVKLLAKQSPSSNISSNESTALYYATTTGKKDKLLLDFLSNSKSISHTSNLKTDWMLFNHIKNNLSHLWNQMLYEDIYNLYYMKNDSIYTSIMTSKEHQDLKNLLLTKYSRNLYKHCTVVYNSSGTGLRELYDSLKSTNNAAGLWWFIRELRHSESNFNSNFFKFALRITGSTNSSSNEFLRMFSTSTGFSITSDLLCFSECASALEDSYESYISYYYASLNNTKRVDDILSSKYFVQSLRRFSPSRLYIFYMLLVSCGSSDSTTSSNISNIIAKFQQNQSGLRDALSKSSRALKLLSWLNGNFHNALGMHAFMSAAEKSKAIETLTGVSGVTLESLKTNKQLCEKVVTSFEVAGLLKALFSESDYVKIVNNLIGVTNSATSIYNLLLESHNFKLAVKNKAASMMCFHPTVINSSLYDNEQHVVEFANSVISREVINTLGLYINSDLFIFPQFTLFALTNKEFMKSAFNWMCDEIIVTHVKAALEHSLSGSVASKIFSEDSFIVEMLDSHPLLWTAVLDNSNKPEIKNHVVNSRVLAKKLLNRNTIKSIIKLYRESTIIAPTIWEIVSKNLTLKSNKVMEINPATELFLEPGVVFLVPRIKHNSDNNRKEGHLNVFNEDGFLVGSSNTRLISSSDTVVFNHNDSSCIVALDHCYFGGGDDNCFIAYEYYAFPEEE